jgi:hypothetical protein
LSGKTAVFTVVARHVVELRGHAGCSTIPSMKYVLLLALLAGGCALDRDIEDRVTIDQGVYGLLLAADQPAANQTVTVFAAGATTAFATMTSDGAGIYQIDLPNGDYTLCTSACTPITTPSSATVRYDWTNGPGGGSWQKI